MRAPKGVTGDRPIAGWIGRWIATWTVCDPIVRSWLSFYYPAVTWCHSLRALLVLACLLLLPDGEAVAQPLVTAFRLAPPYVLQQSDGSLTGLEYELVIAAAQAGGLELRPEIGPFGRLPEDFRRGMGQAFVPASADMQLPGCLSDTLLVYRNVAFSLRQRRLPIASIADLARHDVLAFQNAHDVLGPEVAAMRADNPRYREIANQMLQVRALFSGRTDVAVADRRIFRYLMRSPETGFDPVPEVTEHDLFPPTPYAVAFRDASHCRAFNAGLARIRRDGRFDAILRRWDNSAAP